MKIQSSDAIQSRSVLRMNSEKQKRFYNYSEITNKQKNEKKEKKKRRNNSNK